MRALQYCNRANIYHITFRNLGIASAPISHEGVMEEENLACGMHIAYDAEEWGRGGWGCDYNLMAINSKQTMDI